MVQARLVAINGTRWRACVSRAKMPAGSPNANLTWTAELGETTTLSPDAGGARGMRAPGVGGGGLAEALRLQVGDRLDFNVAGSA
jgi:predicted lysophospholipase L1 biosynthesis ABC-type transport system permease subunit